MWVQDAAILMPKLGNAGRILKRIEKYWNNRKERKLRDGVRFVLFAVA